MRKLVLPAIGCLLLTGFALTGCPSPDSQAVVFPDSNLEAAIREHLAKPEGAIYASELAELVALYADWRDIENLSGLEYCVGLRELSLRNNQITDITPLVNNKGLGAGAWVDVRGNPLSFEHLSKSVPVLEARGVTVYA